MTALAPGVRVGPYELEDLLSEGGFSRVAVARRIDRYGEPRERVAIKLCRTDDGRLGRGGKSDVYQNALQEEAQTLRSLRHPGIVEIYPIPNPAGRLNYTERAIDVDGQPLYFAMEYLAGGPLEELLEDEQSLDMALAMDIAQQLCAALDYMHAKGLAHLDIKASNILFRYPIGGGKWPEAVLIDFGTAQKFSRQADFEGISLPYLPPERVKFMKGEGVPEALMDKAAADMYSAGVVLYRMLSGHLPFEGSKAHIKTAIINNRPTAPHEHNPGLASHPALEALVMRMLDKEPAVRPKAQEVIDELEAIVPSPRLVETLQELPRKSAPPKPHPLARIVTVFAVVGALELAAFAGLVGMTRGSLHLPGLVTTATPASNADATPAAATRPLGPVTTATDAATRAVTGATAQPTGRTPARTPAPAATTPRAANNATGTGARSGPTPTLFDLPTYTPVPVPTPVPTPVPVVEPSPSATGTK